MRREDDDIAKLFKSSLPSVQQEEAAGKRVFYRLLLAQTENPIVPLVHDDEWGTERMGTRFALAFAATGALASLLGLFLTSSLWKTPGHTGPSADPIRAGESVRADSPEGRMLALPDGSQVEMRAQSELQIGNEADGLRLRLNTGSIIVNAAKQGAGHLYVETKDAVVSVVGTIFVVSTEQSGSRTGVIEGVVSVRHGAMSEKLLAREQTATNPAMAPVPLEVQVSWSRNAAVYLALLKPFTLPAQPPIPATPRFSPPIQTPAASQNPQEPDSLLITAPSNGPRPAFGNNEQAMGQALNSRELYTDISFVAETDYFASNKIEYTVPITLKIPGTQLTGSQSAKRISLDIVGQVTDSYGTVIQNFRDAVDVPLADGIVKELPARQISFDLGFTLLAGPYSMKFLVHDRITDRMGTYQKDVVIPNLTRQSENLPVSSVVLSNELINLSDALYNSNTQSALDPLVIDGKKLIPSSLRTFTRRRDLVVFLQAYEPNATTTSPLTASVAFYRGQTKVFETPAMTIKDDLGRALRTLPVQLRVPLSSLAEGAYDCQVSVTDPATQKSVVWRSPINVVN